MYGQNLEALKAEVASKTAELEEVNNVVHLKTHQVTSLNPEH